MQAILPRHPNNPLPAIRRSRSYPTHQDPLSMVMSETPQGRNH